MAFGWGQNTWGIGDWGTGAVNITVEVINPNDVPWGELGWGDGTFGGSNNLNLNLNSVSVQIDVTAIPEGETLVHAIESFVGVSAGGSVSVPVFEDILDTALNNVNVIGTGFVDLTGQDLTLSLNSVTPVSVVEVTGQNLTTFLNTVVIEIPVTVNLTGQNLTSTLGDENAFTDVNVLLTGENLTSTLGSENIIIDVSILLAQENLIVALGVVDPSPDVAVVAPEVGELYLNSVTITGEANVSLIGQNLTLTLNDESAFTDVTVNAIGQTLIGRTGQLYVTAWAPVDTGQSINWTDLAA